MTVLLIDCVGLVREMEISSRWPEVLVPIQRRVWVMINEPIPIHQDVARFRLSPELSWPPVYRQVVT